MEDIASFNGFLTEGIPDILPQHPGISHKVDHAPARRQILSNLEKKLALKNALRYFKPEHHNILAKEFLEELRIALLLGLVS